MRPRQAWLALLFGGAFAGLALWGTALILCSSTSEERRLGVGQEKSFGGLLDSHLHVAVLDVRQSQVLDGPGSRRVTGGLFYDVLLQVRNDAARIDVHPEKLKIVIVAADGTEYRPLSLEGRAAAPDSYAMRFDTPLPRGTSARRRLVFELPPGTRGTALWVTDGAALTRFLPAHENSPLHARVLFDLDGPARAAARP